MLNTPRLRPAAAKKVAAAGTLAALIVLGAGCAFAPTDHTVTASPPARLAQTEQCRLWFDRFDRTVREADVTDAEFTPIAGFPFLRVNRHAQALGTEAVTPRQQAEWIGRLRALDQQARLSEVARLPSDKVIALMPEADASYLPASATNKQRLRRRQDLLGRADDCGQRLAQWVTAQPGRIRQLRSLAVVPDRYSQSMRALGLYPLSSLAVGAGVHRWETETRHAYTKPDRSAMWPAFGTPLTEEPGQLATEIATLPVDSLGVPRVDQQLEQRMLDAFSPVFRIEKTSVSDEPGTITIDRHGTASVDTRHPAVYRRMAFTRYRGRSLIQLVYTIWFPERPATGSLDIYAGRLDGVILRITLSRQGYPVVVDTIHPCGCYHQFFATANVGLQKPPASVGPDEEWRFIASHPLTPSSGKRLHVAIDASTHYVSRIGYQALRPVPGSASLTGLRIYDERSLTRLVEASGQRARSLYTSHGMVEGTDRAERWLLWPMGIRSAGAMRQWGHHATAFVGLRHFDDADLIERRFVLP